MAFAIDVDQVYTLQCPVGNASKGNLLPGTTVFLESVLVDVQGELLMVAFGFSTTDGTKNRFSLPPDVLQEALGVEDLEQKTIEGLVRRAEKIS